jgi:hypothetical protein
LLIGSGEKTTKPDPAHGSTSEVGIVWDPYRVKLIAAFVVDAATGNTKLAVIDRPWVPVYPVVLAAVEGGFTVIVCPPKGCPVSFGSGVAQTIKMVALVVCLLTRPTKC